MVLVTRRSDRSLTPCFILSMANMRLIKPCPDSDWGSPMSTSAEDGVALVASHNAFWGADRTIYSNR